MAARVESRFTVPASTTISVSSGALTAAVPVTFTAGNYFHTSAGGVSSGPTVLTAAINAAVGGAPDNATSAATAMGGTWTAGAGWLCQEASGDLAAAFGGVTLADSGTVTYRTAGPGSGTDYAVGFGATTDYFDGGNNFNVGATDDLIVAWVAKWTALPGLSRELFSKYAGGAGAPYWVVALSSSNTYSFYASDGVDSYDISGASGIAVTADQWHVGMAVLDRTAGVIRIGTCPLGGSPTVSSTVAIPALGATTNAAGFRLGTYPGALSATTANVAALYVSTGASVASGLSAGLSASLTSFASAVSSAFTVSVSTTDGRTTISNSFWPCSMDFDANTMSLLGYAYDFDYPQTAAQLLTALGNGSFSAGYLCNETSGDLAPVFGSITLADSGTPTYSNVGARGGTDKAVGFDSATDAFGGSSVFDAGASDDIAFLLVANFSTVSGNSDILGKGWDGGAGYGLFRESGNVSFYVGDGVDTVNVTAAITAGVWYVIVATVDRSASAARVGVCAIGGSPTVSAATSTAAVGSMSNADNFNLGAQGVYGAGNMQVAYFAALSGSGYATGLSANLSTALSSFATYMKSQTGTQQAKGVWFPGCPLNLEGDPAVAPRVTDTRYSQSPTGFVLGLSGNSFYRHRGIVWSHVARSQAWETAATYANGSYETFAKDAFYGMGHAWFTPASPVQIYWNDAGTDRALGYTFNSSAGVPGWAVINVASTEPKKSSADWTGLWRIEFADVIAVGS